MLGGNSLRHDHAPRVDDELPHLCLVDRVQLMARRTRYRAE
jgi:hypothetical protein